MIREVAYRPSKELLDGESSGPVFRDSLTRETTALIDEADDVHEKRMVNRYARESTQIDVLNRPLVGLAGRSRFGYYCVLVMRLGEVSLGFY